MKKILSILWALLSVLSVTAEPADNNTIDLVITGSYTFYFDVDDEEETSDWFFSATDDTGKYQIRLDWPADYDGKYGTFTNADLDKDYSYIKDFSGEEMEYRDYVDGTTFTVSQVNGKLHMEGSLVCDNGITYNFRFDHTPQTINIEGTELTELYYFTEDTDWYMRFNDDKFRVSLDINTGRKSKFAGTYTEDDAVEGYNFIYDLSTGSYDPFVSLNVTFALPKGVTDPTKACEITGSGVTEHGDTYIFHMLKGLPIEPKKTVNLDVDLKTVEWPSTRDDDCKCYFELTEKDADGNPTENQWNIGLDSMTGSFTADNLIEALTGRINTVTGETLAVDNGKISLSLKPDTWNLELTAALVMKDSIEYCFTADYAVPVKGEVALNFNNLTLNDSYYSDMGYQWLKASNEKASIEVTLTDAVPGEYDDNTMSVAMAVTGDDGFKSAVTSVAIISASTTIDEHNQPVLKTQFLGNNKRVYTVDAYFEIPAVQDTLDISIEGLKAYDYLESLGAFQIYGYNSDSTAYVSIATEAEKFAGHYTTSDLTAFKDYCVLALKKADGTYEQNDFYTADFDVTQQDKAITLVGTFQAGSHLVNLTLRGVIKPQGIDYDSEDADLDVDFTQDDLASIEKNADYGYAYVELQNAARSDVFSMLIYLDEFDDDIVIPAGTYDVNESYAANTVQPGSVGTSTLYPTFYATLEDGYLYSPFWFLTSGTVTVYNNNGELAFEVNGQNSYECKIHVTYNLEGLGIKDVDTARANGLIAKKYIENGRVIIAHPNGRKYNLAGQAVSR